MTDAEIEAVLEQLLEGKPLSAILPGGRQQLRFFQAIEGTAWWTAYARVAAAVAEYRVSEVVRIADRTDLDPRDKQVRIDARKWYAGAVKPSKYGPKLEVNHVGQIDLVAVNAEVEQRIAQLAPVQHPPTNPQVQNADWEPVGEVRPSDSVSDAPASPAPQPDVDAGGGAGGSTDTGHV